MFCFVIIDSIVCVCGKAGGKGCVRACVCSHLSSCVDEFALRHEHLARVEAAVLHGRDLVAHHLVVVRLHLAQHQLHLAQQRSLGGLARPAVLHQLVASVVEDGQLLRS